MKKEKVLLIKFMIINGLAFFGYAFTNIFLIPFLDQLGYDAVARSWLFALGAIVTIVGQFAFGYLCDYFKTDKWVFFGISIFFAIVNWILYSLQISDIFIVTSFTLLVFSMFRIVQGILDCWVIESDEYCLDNYGAIRAFGAIGWAISCPIAAVVLEHLGYQAIGTSFTIITIITLVLAYFIEDAQKVVSDNKIEFSDTMLLLKNQDFLIYTMIFFFLFMSITADAYITIDKMLNLGASSAEISYKWSFQAICELPLFFLGGWFIKKYGGNKVLIFVSVMYFLRFFGFAYASTPMQIVYISGLQMVTYPLVMICSKQMIDSTAPVNLRATAQQLATSIYSGGSLLITPIVCGLLSGVFNTDVALMGAGILSLVPIGLIAIYRIIKKGEMK